jgi:hypothetical protein
MLACFTRGEAAASCGLMPWPPATTGLRGLAPLEIGESLLSGSLVGAASKSSAGAAEPPIA